RAEPAVLARFGPDTKLRVVRSEPGEAALEGRLLDRQVLRMDERAHRIAVGGDLALAIAEHFAPARGVPVGVRRDVVLPRAVARTAYCTREPRLGELSRIFGFVRARDVHRRADEATRFSHVVVLECGVGCEPPCGAIRRLHLALQKERCLLPGGPAVLLDPANAVFAAQEH